MKYLALLWQTTCLSLAAASASVPPMPCHETPLEKVQTWSLKGKIEAVGAALLIPLALKVYLHIRRQHKNQLFLVYYFALFYKDKLNDQHVLGDIEGKEVLFEAIHPFSVSAYILGKADTFEAPSNTDKNALKFVKKNALEYFEKKLSKAPPSRLPKKTALVGAVVLILGAVSLFVDLRRLHTNRLFSGYSSGLSDKNKLNHRIAVSSESEEGPFKPVHPLPVNAPIVQKTNRSEEPPTADTNTLKFVKKHALAHVKKRLLEALTWRLRTKMELVGAVVLIIGAANRFLYLRRLHASQLFLEHYFALAFEEKIGEKQVVGEAQKIEILFEDVHPFSVSAHILGKADTFEAPSNTDKNALKFVKKIALAYLKQKKN